MDEKLSVAMVKVCLKAIFIPFSAKMTKNCESISIHQRDEEKRGLYSLDGYGRDIVK